MIDKTHILNEIKRTAAENGGSPLGRLRFQTETGIKYAEWFGVHWVRWNDALAEAGFLPNQFKSAYDDNHMFVKLASLVRELGHFPVGGELKMKARRDKEFPNDKTFYRLGNKQELIRKLLDFCSKQTGYEDVITICAPLVSSTTISADSSLERTDIQMGFVYLLKSGRHYKIGRTIALNRRERELAIQLPEKAKVVHTIKTDDPSGIEAYWHRRFADKRGNGEWFDLDPKDVSAFKRRKFM